MIYWTRRCVVVLYALYYGSVYCSMTIYYIKLIAGPRPDLDPDIIAALDDDFDFENKEYELEDNFVELANLEQGVIEGEPTAEDLEGLFSSDDEDGNNSEHDDYEDEMGDSLGSLKGPHQYMSDDDDENKSRFTNYSMSSSVVRRNKQLLLVDDCFEKVSFVKIIKLLFSSVDCTAHVTICIHVFVYRCLKDTMTQKLGRWIATKSRATSMQIQTCY